MNYNLLILVWVVENNRMLILTTSGNVFIENRQDSIGIPNTLPSNLLIKSTRLINLIFKNANIGSDGTCDLDGTNNVRNETNVKDCF